jgi:hypothetical protein
MTTVNRIGGILTFRVDGVQYQARGNFMIEGASLKREGVAGLDNVHGYIETPIVPTIKGDISIGNKLSIAALQGITQSTAQADLANGTSFVLSQAWTADSYVVDAHDGKIGITLQGMQCAQI